MAMERDTVRGSGSGRPSRGRVGIGVLVLATTIAACSAAASGTPAGATASLRASTAPTTPASSALSSAGPSPASSRSASPTASLTGTVPPVSSAPWTSLSVERLVHAPVDPLAVVPWDGGVVAVGRAAADAPMQAWISRDGRTWALLPAATLGLDDQEVTVLGGTACGPGVLLMTEDASGGATVWSSQDGVTWSRATGFPWAPGAGGYGTGLFAGGASGAVAVAGLGPSVAVTSDCRTWRTVPLPGPAATTVTAVAAFGDGSVAVGYTGTVGTSTVAPVAWWSEDGASWTSASIAAMTGDGFIEVRAGPRGLIAVSTQPQDIPGRTTLWASPDGRSWTRTTPGPLGVITSGEGQGGLSGIFLGDGSRLMTFGDDAAFWTSADGVDWSALHLTGAASELDAEQPAPLLLRDGLFFGGSDTSWFAAGS